MKITEVTSKTFFYSTKTVSDDEGHNHPDPDLKEHKVKGQKKADKISKIKTKNVFKGKKKEPIT